MQLAQLFFFHGRRGLRQQVLRTLTYGNTSQGPDVSDRLVEITVSDGALVSLPAVSTVLINAVNDAPVLDNSGEMTLPSIVEDEANSSGSSVPRATTSASTMAPPPARRCRTCTCI